MEQQNVMKPIYVTTVWDINTNTEQNIPLLFSANYYIKKGYTEKINLLLLSKSDDNSYLQELVNTGIYEIHDCSKLFQEISTQYPKFDKFGEYEKNCFLRWILIDRYFKHCPFIHIDGDVVFNEDLSIISTLSSRHTFVLQGCPAFSVINNHEWIKQYESELNKFHDDISNYSRIAWKLRKNWRSSKNDKWAGSRYRRIISSDQDLISHLIHCNLLIQDRPKEILETFSQYILFENPLYISSHNQAPLKYWYEEEIDYFNNKRVLLWHFQKYFSEYLLASVIHRLLFRIPFIPKKFKPLSENPNLYARFLYGVVKILGIDRRTAYNKYLLSSTRFSNIYSDASWWQNNAFTQ